MIGVTIAVLGIVGETRRNDASRADLVKCRRANSWKNAMWQNIKYYVIAYGIVVLGAFVSTGLELLPGLFPEFGPMDKLATNLSGITLGSVIMVVGLIRDKRFTDAQEEANQQRKRAEKAEAAIGQANQQAQMAVQQAEQERQRAQKAEAELARVRAEYETETRARLRRLEEAIGMAPPEPERD